MPQHSKSRKKKFFVKEEDGIFTVHKEFFDDIESRDEAMGIALRTLGEVHAVLEEEGRSKVSIKIGNMKAVTGLQRCLDELDKRYPFLSTELRAVQRKINGQTLNIC